MVLIIINSRRIFHALPPQSPQSMERGGAAHRLPHCFLRFSDKHDNITINITINIPVLLLILYY